MKIFHTKTFEKAYKSAPEQIRKAFKKQAWYLLKDMRHPSLHAKKYDESLGAWQARVNQSWRFYFVIHGDGYYLLDITEHPK